MTVPVSNPSVSYVAAGVGPYAVPFPFADAADVKVLLRSTAGVQSSPSFTLTNANVTLAVAPASGVVIIYRDTPDDQTLALSDLSAFPAKAVEVALDRQVMRHQELVQDFNSTVRAPKGEALSPLPLADARKGRLAAYDAAGQPTTFFPEQISETLVGPLQTIAELRSSPWVFGPPSEVALISNYFTGDGGGNFWVDPTDIASVDDGVLTIVDTAGRRWKRKYSGDIDARWAGCVGDSTATVAGTDNLTAFARLNALGTVVVNFPATPTNYYYTTGAFVDIQFRAVGRGQIRTAGGNILPQTYTRIRTPTNFGTNNQNQFNGDCRFITGSYYAFASRSPTINAHYFNKNLIPEYKFSEHEINSGSSGAIAFTTAAILTSSTSVPVSSTDGLFIGQVVGFGQGFTFAATVTITNIVGLTVFWSGAIGVAYASDTAITDSPRTMGLTTMWNTASEAYGDTYCNAMRISTSTSTVRAGQKNIFETRTIGLTGGDVILAGSWAYGTGIEIQISEGAGAVGNGAITFPLYFDRQSNNVTRGAMWMAMYANSAGPVACDAVLSVANRWKVGLDTTLASSADLQAATQMAKGHKIGFNATATPSAGLALWGNVPPTTWQAQRTTDDAFETVVNGVVAHEIVPNGTNREISTPASTFVSVRRSATSAAITGNGTDANIAFDTEVADVGNRYASPSFTAAVAGTYLIALNITMAGLTASHTTSRLSLFRSDGIVVGRSVINPWALNSGDAVVTQTLTALVNMTAGQTITPRLQVVGGGLSVTVIGGAQYDSYMNISKVR